MDEPINVGDLVVNHDDTLRQVIRVIKIQGDRLRGRYVLPSGQVEAFDYAPVANYRQASAEEERGAHQRGQLPPD